MPEHVLVIGATGNIGVSAVKGALNSGRQVLAIVRNQASAEKLYKHVGSTEGIKVIEADATSDTGIKSVVDQVKAGKLPDFQHVYTCVGGEYTNVPLKSITTERLRKNINMSLEANFFAYRDTIEYLQEQGHPDSTWTICTGSQGDMAIFALPAITQGPLFSMATAAARENEKTNVRVNEVYLMFRVEVDEDAAQHGVTSSSEFAANYEGILSNPEIRSSRVRVASPADIKDLKWAKKF
ncbi:short chain dehydrogenase domain-containing protein [Trichoderma breve]|uniref:Short chain dehydrogenase domain-containing protein n=1 Tax=Trichoderma breve TaxID=2034170 RepID=A0A9W9E9F6_9HYPO|nr:short chain dehydrogenase domain-containing protein [Trichoderma breve]KAJ4859656.1 short chain dehydrogenase domain-containing protein [Trichoderma breve]